MELGLEMNRRSEERSGETKRSALRDFLESTTTKDPGMVTFGNRLQWRSGVGHRTNLQQLHIRLVVPG